MPQQFLPKELGGSNAITGLVDIRVQPGNNSDMLADVILYDLPPNHQNKLWSDNLKIGRFKQKDNNRFFTANPNDIVSVVLNKQQKPILIYNHTTGSYGSTKLSRFYIPVGVPPNFVAFAIVILVAIDYGVINLLLGSLKSASDQFHLPVFFVVFFTICLGLVCNPIAQCILVLVYYAIQGRKVVALCSWLEKNGLPQRATAPSNSYTSI